MLLYKTTRYLQRKILLKVLLRNIQAYHTSANNSKRLGNKKSVIILSGSMTKLLDGWAMAKRIQFNCKIYVKTFSGTTVLCMEDYMKPS